MMRYQRRATPTEGRRSADYNTVVWEPHGTFGYLKKLYRMGVFGFGYGGWGLRPYPPYGNLCDGKLTWGFV